MTYDDWKATDPRDSEPEGDGAPICERCGGPCGDTCPADHCEDCGAGIPEGDAHACPLMAADIAADSESDDLR